MIDTMTNCEGWSETVAVRFPETEAGPRILEKMLSLWVISGCSSWIISNEKN